MIEMRSAGFLPSALPGFFPVLFKDQGPIAARAKGNILSNLACLDSKWPDAAHALILVLTDLP
jgi:hypothetical protein